jgi:hypothetical protein
MTIGSPQALPFPHSPFNSLYHSCQLNASISFFFVWLSTLKTISFFSQPWIV